MPLQVKLLGFAIIGFIILITIIIANKDSNFKIIILHNNDMHARFEQCGIIGDKCSKIDADKNKCYGGFARIAYKVKEFRKRASKGEIPNVLFLNAGDTYTGTPWFSLFKDEIASDFLNILKPDAASLGNHEFDEGTENLASFLRKVKFPVLFANVILHNGSDLKPNMFKPSMILDVGGRKIGIIGYLSQEVKNLLRPSVKMESVEITDEVIAINKESSKLKKEGVNIIIALGHSGYNIDQKIAAECPDVDVVVGAHSHTFLYTGKEPSLEPAEGDYPTMITQASGKRVPVVQAFWFTKYLGYIQIEFDKDGELVKIDGAPILLDGSVPQDPDVLQLLEKYRPGMLDYESEVGSTKVLLDGSCRRNECNMGNLITDAMIDWYSSISARSEALSDSPIASLIVGGGIRASINLESNNGIITKGDAATVLPFGSTMEVMEVSGKTLLDALEHSVHRYTDGEKHGEFLQLSGMKVVYDMNRPSYNRVIDTKVLHSDCVYYDCFNINATKLYKIVTQEFLTNGGDGFEMFKDKPTMKTDVIDLDIFIQYLKKMSPVNPRIEGRIIIIDKIKP